MNEEEKTLNLDDVKFCSKKYMQHSRQETMLFLDIVTTRQK